MYRRHVPALALTLVCASFFIHKPAAGQTPASTEIREPQIIPTQVPLTPDGKCRKTRMESAAVSVNISEQGIPGDAYFQEASGTEAADWALQAVLSDRFVPAQQDGMPRAVRRDISVLMDTCVEKVKLPDGTKSEHLSLKALPKQTIRPDRSNGVEANAGTEPKAVDTSKPYRVGGSISAPVGVYTPEAHYSPEARKARTQGTCLIRLMVDAHGLPLDPRIIKSLEGLDQQALEAVRRYRFHPAMKDGTVPVPVLVTIKVTFRLY